jgi:hypothetical protein
MLHYGTRGSESRSRCGTACHNTAMKVVALGGGVGQLQRRCRRTAERWQPRRGTWRQWVVPERWHKTSIYRDGDEDGDDELET